MSKHTRKTNPPQQSVSTDLATTAKARLEELVPQIQGKHDMVEHRLADTLEYAQQAGELLLEAKKLAGHGGWLPVSEGVRHSRPHRVRVYEDREAVGED